MNAHSRDHVVSTTITVAASAERVWTAITVPEQLIQWYAPGCRWEIPELAQGAEVRFYNTETDIQRATIERCLPPSEFVLRWTPDPTLPGTTLINTYTIRTVARGTSVTISQTGYASVPEDQRASWIKGDEGAFPAIGAALAAFLG